SLENSAFTLGKSKWKVFWTISFPLAWPGLVAGLVLSFALGLREFGATLMLALYILNATDAVPLAIDFAVEFNQLDIAKFWVAIIIILGFSAIFWLNWWSSRKMMKHSR